MITAPAILEKTTAGIPGHRIQLSGLRIQKAEASGQKPEKTQKAGYRSQKSGPLQLKMCFSREIIYKELEQAVRIAWQKYDLF